MSVRTVPDMVTFIRDRIRETTANAWTNDQIMRTLNARLMQASRMLAQAHPTFLHDSTTISYVADQSEYSLPETFWGLLAPPLRTDLEPDAPISFGEYSHFYKWLGTTGLNIDRNGERYFFEGSKLKIQPTPTAATGTLSLHFVRRPPEVHSATADAGSSTTITFPASGTYGDPVTRDDYYNGADIFIHSGTAAGEQATITDYDGGTRVATVDFDSTPDATSVYSVLTPLPEEFNHAICYGTAADLLNDMGIPNGFSQVADQWLFEMKSSLDRHEGARYVNVVDEDRYV